MPYTTRQKLIRCPSCGGARWANMAKLLPDGWQCTCLACNQVWSCGPPSTLKTIRKRVEVAKPQPPPEQPQVPAFCAGDRVLVLPPGTHAGRTGKIVLFRSKHMASVRFDDSKAKATICVNHLCHTSHQSTASWRDGAPKPKPTASDSMFLPGSRGRFNEDG